LDKLLSIKQIIYYLDKLPGIKQIIYYLDKLPGIKQIIRCLQGVKTPCSKGRSLYRPFFISKILILSDCDI